MPRVQFSTESVAPDLRRDVVEAAYGAHVSGDVDFIGGAPVSARLTLRDMGGLQVARVETSPMRIATSADDTGVVYLSMTTSGSGVIDARGEARPVQAGDINVLRRDRRCLTVAAEPCALLNIAIPRDRLMESLASHDNLLGTRSMSAPAARLLQSYAMTLLEDDRMLAPEEEAVFAAHILDLTALLLGPRRDAAETARSGGVRAARRQSIRADIAANLADPALSLDWLARRHGLSVHYVRALFYDEGTSFTDHVLSARLAHVCTLLGDPAMSGHTIAALALMAGFGDISWFNQVFRRRYGMTPSDMRALGAGYC